VSVEVGTECGTEGMYFMISSLVAGTLVGSRRVVVINVSTEHR
jgi:hypothetical protein